MTVPRKIFPECPIERTLAVLSGRWKAMILWRLLVRPHRYSELNTSVEGITQRVLTQALSELEEDGVIEKCDKGWKLTSLGVTLERPLKDMFDWGTAHARSVPHR